MAARINAAFTLGKMRTAAQDAEFLILELVEVAVRALSPGVNDPFTAVMCLDRLGATLCQLAGRAFPSAYRRDARGVVRVIAPARSFPGMLDAAFGEIRHYGKADPLITRRLLEVLDEVAQCARTEEQRQALLRQAALTREAALEEATSKEDRLTIEESYRRIASRNRHTA